MFNERIYNFSAGPSMLPLPVLERAAKEMLNYGGSGMSVMEMSHRSKVYAKIFADTKEKFRAIMQIPENYEILFLQGGASTQFSAIPLNLMGLTGKADYALTGNFSTAAWKEAKRYGDAAVACSSEDTNHNYIPEALSVREDASYFYYCSNNTIYGTQWKSVPEVGDIPIVCDMSSDICSKPIDVSKYGVIYAGAQKNLAPAGLTIVIVRKDLLGHAMPQTPMMLDWKIQADNDSMKNTPPCWCIYVLGLVCDWLEEMGGLAGIQKVNEMKAKMLYDVLEQTEIFTCHAQKAARSDMNVTFRTASSELDALFVSQAAEAGMSNLKGHRMTGGMRASIYNAMPVEGVEKLCDFIRDFDKNNR